VKNLFNISKKNKNFLKPLIVNNKQFKSSDVNILLNRVKTNARSELRKKIFSVIISLIGVLVFAYIFFE
jgi:hypothetical protein|tara:strand:- start:558 stop:764 length:207 start_codon:yes stop_codon:yes gene_type:complete